MEWVHEVLVEGDASVAGVAGLLRRLDAVAARAPGTRFLLDETGFRALSIGPREMREIAATWRATVHLPQARVAVVAPSPLVYGLNRMAISLADADNVAVFRTREEAEAWLTL